jgi:NadR type nicotinamide-nucleotide adenylyltransferase
MIQKVAIIGPECTGKTTLAQKLAVHFSTIWVPEYARLYIEKLGRPYKYNDVEQIATFQYNQIKENYADANRFVFFDTDLIITKVWFEVVFGKTPHWLDKAIRESNFLLYLLCDTSLPWKPDNVRENGGVMRNKLFDMYQQNLEMYNFKYNIIAGIGDERTSFAINFINK